MMDKLEYEYIDIEPTDPVNGNPETLAANDSVWLGLEFDVQFKGTDYSTLYSIDLCNIVSLRTDECREFYGPQYRNHLKKIVAGFRTKYGAERLKGTHREYELSRRFIIYDRVLYCRRFVWHDVKNHILHIFDKARGPDQEATIRMICDSFGCVDQNRYCGSNY